MVHAWLRRRERGHPSSVARGPEPRRRVLWRACKRRLPPRNFGTPEKLAAEIAKEKEVTDACKRAVRAGQPLFRRLLAHRSGDVRMNAAYCLGAIGERDLRAAAASAEPRLSDGRETSSAAPGVRGSATKSGIRRNTKGRVMVGEKDTPRATSGGGTEPPTPRERYMLFAQGFRDGAGMHAMRAAHKGLDAYERGYAEGRAARAHTCEAYAKEIEYEPPSLRTDEEQS